MFEALSINAEHKDLLHDIAYDHYGKRMATFSSDYIVKVWDEDDHGNWNLSASWKAHDSSIRKVTWAHPEFGQVIVTCSFDNSVIVWEETVNSSSKKIKKLWEQKAILNDSKGVITDVKFAPKLLGFMFAVCDNYGVVRIYQAPDTINLHNCQLLHEFNSKFPISCLSWNPSLSKLHPPMIAVGTDDNSEIGGKVFIYEYAENSRKWSKTETLSCIPDQVHDIAFAPNLGSNYYTLAVATKDVKIVSLKPLVESAQNGLARFKVSLIAQFDDHYCTVWRVCWNIMGTILASSGDDGCVRLWKDNYINQWKCVAVLKGDGNSAQGTENFLSTGSNMNQNLGSQQSLSSTRYYKLGSISHTNQVPWH